MASTDPRADGPRRRVFSPANKLAHLAAYEQACETNEGGAYLRREGLYSSLISEWRARLKQELARANKRLTITEAALDIAGKAHALLESPSERAYFDDKRNKR